MRLSHPDLDLALLILTIVPCIYFGIVEGITRGMRKPRKIRLATHPFRREGDKYAYYFYLVYKYVGPNSIIGRIPRLGALPSGILAGFALKLVVTKGEQYSLCQKQKRNAQNAK